MNPTIQSLARQFKELKDRYESHEDQLKALGREWEEIETKLLEAMVEEGVNSIDVQDVGKISMRTENYLSVNAENAPHFYEYMRLSGHGAMIKEYVNPRTLTSWLKTHLAEIQEGYLSKQDMDEFEARDAALAFLKEKGANYFTKRGLSLRAK